jgi:hypothetical protein
MATSTPKKIVTLMANFRLDVVGGRTYGMCSVEVSEPLEFLSFKKGFPLVSPNGQRCSIYSTRMALEIALTHSETMASNGGSKDEEYFYTIVTRSSNVYNVLFKENGVESNKTRNWLAETDNGGRKNRSMLKLCGYTKSFLIEMIAMVDVLRETGRGDVVFAPMEETDDVLSKACVNLDVDPERDLDGTDREGKCDEETTKMRLDNAKRKDALRKELLGAGIVRGTRKGRNLTKKERKEILLSEVKS